MNPTPKTKIIRLKGQKLAKLNEMIHQRDQHKCIYCGNRVDPGEKCNDVKEYCRKYLINLYGESIYSK